MLLYPATVFPAPALWDGRTAEVTSRWRGANASRPTHQGDDYFYRRRPYDFQPGFGKDSRWTVPRGVPAIAAAAGVVEVQRHGRIATGYRLWIAHDDGHSSGYFHLRSLLVSPGARVLAGEPVGIIGHNPTDSPASAHLHFEVSPSSGYAPIDPLAWLERRGAVHAPARAGARELAALAAAAGAAWLASGGLS
jgi:murein DD-endopeptidase MepM/ murein hydrolase activator NlpD